MNGARAPCGLFGKTPAAGDFLRLNLPAGTASVLDAWIEAGLAHLAAQATDWAHGFADAPAWRFVTTAGEAGPSPLAGVVAPSRDRVGRSFPCMALAPLDGLEPQAAVACTPWFDRAEAAVAVARDGGTPDALAVKFAALGAPRADDLDVLSLRARSTDDGLFLDVRSGPDGRAVTLQAVLETTPLASGASLWWRHTGAGAKVLMTPGLPGREAFAALFRASEGERP
ncbi:type VI secretion system-associated protein TagF [Caulobacter sp. S45]|uniref:type VI secretion system-associated protein TagF n=1 Tax=Caulobacter sp. S45 TaxID=1641861 RepID=UPI0015772365|nr:type VI secretion system-associated protein TagF [Caulobacter sp. S45]